MQRRWEMADNGKTDEATRLVEVDHGQASPPSTDLVPVDQVSGLPVPRPLLCVSCKRDGGCASPL